jgi:hypothetical protein
MTSDNFCYWLQGWFELNDTIDHSSGATPETMNMIRSHLELVFRKETLGYELINTRFTGLSTNPLC